jgi:hypothetical protein
MPRKIFKGGNCYFDFTEKIDLDTVLPDEKSINLLPGDKTGSSDELNKTNIIILDDSSMPIGEDEDINDILNEDQLKELDKLKSKIQKHNCSTIADGILVTACSSGMDGGGILLDATQKKGSSLFADLEKYCKSINSAEMEADINSFLNSQTTEEIMNTKISRYANLSNFISRNNKDYKATLFINCNPFYEYDKTEKNDFDERKILIKQIECHEYNADIVMAYEYELFDEINGIRGTFTDDIIKDKITEIIDGKTVIKGKYREYPYLDKEKIIELCRNTTKPIYSNNSAIHKFIESQRRYLDEGIGIRERRIIQDYTKINSSFYFYILYKTNNCNFNDFREFSDSFYAQIHDLYSSNPEYNQELTKIYDEHLQKDRKNIPIRAGSKSWFEHWIENIRIRNDFKEKQHGTQPEIMGIHAKKSIFADCEFIKWEDVVQKFIDDVTKIIIAAPAVPETIHGYRGVSGHYVHLNDQELLDAQIRAAINKYKPSSGGLSLGDTIANRSTFVNTRLSSITFDFDISMKFYNKFSTPNPAIYKTSILKGCHVLLAAPLSTYYEEFEIIIPPFAVTQYIDEAAAGAVEKSSNNIKVRHAICTPQTFKTYYHVIVKTPNNYNEYLQAPRAYVDKQRRTYTKEEKEVILQKFVRRIENKVAARDPILCSSNSRKKCSTTTGGKKSKSKTKK